IDLLMPDQDGIETLAKLRHNGYTGKFIMISQVENKEMVGEAYQNGIEFFIHKPINRVEVEHVLSKVNDQWKYERYVLGNQAFHGQIKYGGIPSRIQRTNGS
ncbi:response regulator, partial [Bacillus velezensis]